MEKQEEIRIRKAKAEDIQGVTEVFYRTWLATYPNKEAGITKEDIEYRFKDAFTKESLAERARKIVPTCKGEAFLVAEYESKIVGICWVKQYYDKNELLAIYVLCGYQGKGVGSSLWKEAQVYFSPNKKTVVWVAKYNEKTIEFYRGLGFKETGREYQKEEHRMKSGAYITEIEMAILK